MCELCISKTEDGRFKNVQRGRGKIKGHHPANNHLPTTLKTEYHRKVSICCRLFDLFTINRKGAAVSAFEEYRKD